MIRASDRSRIAAAGPVEAAALLARMHADDAAELLAEMSDERRAAVGEWLPEPQGRRIRVLLGAEPATAGALMSRRYVALREDATVADALERVRNRGPERESVAVVFVCDEPGRLRNSLGLERLVQAPPDSRLGDLEHVSVDCLDQSAGLEEMARRLAGCDLPAVPVVDARDRVVGVITADDVLELWLRR
jgi:magnesium transporter